MQRAIYPGTFDPLTNGHLDLIERTSRMFEQVIIGIAWSEKKSPLFDLQQRIDLATQACSHLNNVSVTSFTGLMVHFAEAQQASVVIRGIRTATDFEYEMQLTNMNREMYPSLETVFLTTPPNLNHISATLVREIASMGGEINKFVPPVVAEALQNKFR